MLGLIPIGIGLVVVVYACYLLKRASQICNWRTTTGIIDKCHSEHMEEDHYRIDIAYSYTVDGRSFVGDRVSLGGPRWDKPNVERQLRLYPKGARVNVWYNPDRKEECFLELVKNRDGWSLIIGGCLFIGVGILVYCTGTRSTGYPFYGQLLRQTGEKLTQPPAAASAGRGP